LLRSHAPGLLPSFRTIGGHRRFPMGRGEAIGSTEPAPQVPDLPQRLDELAEDLERVVPVQRR
jgi:hypothetical protein